MSNSSSELLGHVPVCAQHTIQPYRKSVKPDKCTYCRVYWAGRADAAQAVADIEWDSPLGLHQFRHAAIDAAGGVA